MSKELIDFSALIDEKFEMTIVQEDGFWYFLQGCLNSLLFSLFPS